MGNKSCRKLKDINHDEVNVKCKFIAIIRMKTDFITMKRVCGIFVSILVCQTAIPRDGATVKRLSKKLI